MSAAMMLASCGGTKDAGKTDQALIGKSDIKIEGKRMTPEALCGLLQCPREQEQPGSFCDERGWNG